MLLREIGASGLVKTGHQEAESAESPSGTPFSKGPPHPRRDAFQKPPPGLRPRGSRLGPFSAASEPLAPGRHPLVPRGPVTPGGGSQIRREGSARALPTPAHRGWRRRVGFQSCARRPAGLREAGGTGVGTPGLRQAGAAPRAHSPSLPCAAAAAASTQPHSRARQARGARRSMPPPRSGPGPRLPHARLSARSRPRPARNFSPPAPVLNGSWVRTGSCSFMPCADVTEATPSGMSLKGQGWHRARREGSPEGFEEDLGALWAAWSPPGPPKFQL